MQTHYPYSFLALLSVVVVAFSHERGQKKRKKIIVVFYAEDTDKNAERENYDILKQAFRILRIGVAIEREEPLAF